MNRFPLYASLAALALSIASLAIVGARGPTPAGPRGEKAADGKKEKPPEIGDWMRPLQLHVAKLWFAGKHRNWSLVRFQLDEIDELMQEVARHDIKEGGVHLGERMKKIREAEVKKLERTASLKKLERFVSAYDSLIKACNACHTDSGHAYIRIVRPARPPIGNQDYGPPGKG